MQRLRALLRSERGDLSIDAMFGAVIITVIMAAAGSVLMAATTAATGNDQITASSIVLNTVLSDEKPNLANYTATPQAIIRPVNGQNSSIAIWREDPSPGLSVLNAATKKPSKIAEDANCLGTDRFDSAKCLTSRTVITTSSSGVEITPVPLSPGTAGALQDFTVPAGTGELRYVFKVTEAAADSALTFGNRDHTDVSHTVKIPAGQTGYFYGRILVNAGSKLYLSATGPAVIDPASITIYEAPK